MKKGLLVAAVLCAAIGSNAQINKGQYLVGGSAGFQQSKAGEEKTTTIFLSPNAGYFVADKLAVGLDANFRSDKTTEDGDDLSKQSSFNVGPFVRYYFLPTAQKVNVFAHGAFRFGSIKVGDADGVSSTDWTIKAGPAFFLSPSVALETAVYYGSLKYKDVDAINNFGLSVGFQIHLGGKK
jgi:hypothetical protein